MVRTVIYSCKMSKVNIVLFTFTTRLANSEDELLVIFLSFPGKQVLIFHTNCLH